MLQRLRKHLTPSVFIALIALVFALTGGAFAATGGGSSSHATLTASAAKSKAKSKTKAGARGPAGPAGKNGTNGANGAAGAQGPAGPQGAAGGKGETGSPGTDGTDGTDGTNGTNGAEGSPWTDGGTLPSESTETGQWAVGQYMPGTEAIESVDVGLSFTIPLAKRLNSEHVHFIRLGEGENEEESKWAPAIKEGNCKGSVEKPEATSGNLCVFTLSSINYGAGAVESVAFSIENAETGNEGAGKTGAYLTDGFKVPHAGFLVIKGDWAVTG